MLNGWEKNWLDPARVREEEGAGGEPFLSSADVKIAFKSFEDALDSLLSTWRTNRKPLDARLLLVLVRGGGRKSRKAGKKGKKGACRKKFNRLTRCLSSKKIRGENSVIVFLYGCHRVV